MAGRHGAGTWRSSAGKTQCQGSRRNSLARDALRPTHLSVNIALRATAAHELPHAGRRARQRRRSACQRPRALLLRCTPLLLGLQVGAQRSQRVLLHGRATAAAHQLPQEFNHKLPRSR